MQGAYYQEAMGIMSLKMQTISRCKRRTKLYRPANISVPCIAVYIVPSMEIHGHSRLILARFKCCTNARYILSRSNGHEEFKN